MAVSSSSLYVSRSGQWTLVDEKWSHDDDYCYTPLLTQWPTTAPLGRAMVVKRQSEVNHTNKLHVSCPLDCICTIVHCHLALPPTVLLIHSHSKQCFFSPFLLLFVASLHFSLATIQHSALALINCENKFLHRCLQSLPVQ